MRTVCSSMESNMPAIRMEFAGYVGNHIEELRAKFQLYKIILQVLLSLSTDTSMPTFESHCFEMALVINCISGGMRTRILMAGCYKNSCPEFQLQGVSAPQTRGGTLSGREKSVIFLEKYKLPQNVTEGRRLSLPFKMNVTAGDATFRRTKHTKTQSLSGSLCVPCFKCVFDYFRDYFWS